MSTNAGEPSGAVDRFCARTREHGAAVTRVPIEEGTAALAEACDPPAVATDLPWPEVELPDDAIREPTPKQLEAATTGVTPAVGAIADYGSLLVRATSGGVEPVSLFPERHVAVLRESDVVPSVAAALSAYGDAFRDEGASLVVATGPSATADMGDLVVGAHGPREVRVILLEDGDGNGNEYGNGNGGER